MVENVQSEIFGDFGRILQASAGAKLETAADREAVEQATRDHATRPAKERHLADQNVARSIKQDFRDREFWRAATPESVVNRLTVARALAAEHPEAVAAHMRGVKVIRKHYDLDMERIGSEHLNLGEYRAEAIRELTAAFARADTEAARIHAIRVSQQHTQRGSWQAAALEREVYNDKFWIAAGSESIADRVAVARHLSQDHPAAKTAYLHACDVLRTTYGISVEKINREHPHSPEDRHAALREALDEYFAREQLDPE